MISQWVYSPNSTLMQSTNRIKVVGFDPSLRNWGIATGSVIPGQPNTLTLDYVTIINPILPKGKQVRQNSLDLEAAKQLCDGAVKAAQGAQTVFVEVPVGSQSARAMASYGICVGVIGSLRAMGIPVIEVTPTEVKISATGKATATKSEMINWAVAKHPEVVWPTYLQKGKRLVSESTAEHQADATAAIYAGMACNTFQQMLSLMGAQR